MVRLANRQDGEIYAIVEKNLGGGQLRVKCLDGVSRLCKIRGKFTGKKKEIVAVDYWVLVGIHSFDSKPKCSLLEIYTPHEVNQLKMTNENWTAFGVEQEQSEIDETIETQSVVVSSEINIDDI
jgi:translation initiation factor 1A